MIREIVNDKFDLDNDWNSFANFFGDLFIYKELWKNWSMANSHESSLNAQHLEYRFCLFTCIGFLVIYLTNKMIMLCIWQAYKA